MGRAPFEHRRLKGLKMRRPFRSQSLAVAAFAILLPAAAQAQQGSASSNRLMFDPSGLQGSDSRKTMQPPATQTTGQSGATRQTAVPATNTPTTSTTTQPATASKPAARTTTASAPARPAAARKPAPAANSSTSQTATDSTRASERPIPREQPGALGRIDLPGGSVGYESQTSMRPYDLGDGRRVPGTDNIQRNDSSYFGLSLRMPTSSSGSSIFGRHGAD